MDNDENAFATVNHNITLLLAYRQIADRACYCHRKNADAMNRRPTMSRSIRLIRQRVFSCGFKSSINKKPC
jgi:hypothetical protein